MYAESVADRSQKLMCGICSSVIALDACFNTLIVLDVTFLLRVAYCYAILNMPHISHVVDHCVMQMCQDANMFR